MALRPYSRAGRIALLEVGETYSESFRMSFHEMGDTNTPTHVKTRMCNSMSPAVSRAQSETGNSYATESVVAPTSDTVAVIITVAVTRWA